MDEPPVASATVRRYALPLAAASAAGDSGPSREGALLELRDEAGNMGRGDAAPLPGFSRESASGAARQLLDPGLPDSPTEESYPSVRFASELARLSLRAAASGETLTRLMTEKPRDTVYLNALIPPRAEAVSEARRLKEAGYRAVKLKVGRLAVDEDAALVNRVAEVLGGTPLRLDANRAWTLEEARRFARGIRGVKVEYVEEPLADAALLPRFAEESGLPVALDESLVGMPAPELPDHAYATAVVLKPTLLGGLWRALDLAARADELGMVPVVSSAFESGVGTLGLVALAAALPGPGVPAGLDAYRRLGADVLRPPLELGPELEVPRILGVERTPDPLYLGPAEGDA